MNQPIARRPEDRYEPEPVEDDAAPSTKPEIIGAPRRIRSELVRLDGQILAHQDIVEALYAFVRAPEARKLLNRLHGGLEETHKLSQRITQSVERG